MDVVSYLLSRAYVKKSLIGLGAIKGSNAMINSIVDNPDGTHDITFAWKDTNDVLHTSVLTVSNGETPTITVTPTSTGNVVRFETDNPAQDYSVNIKDGISVTDADVNASNHLIITLSDGTTIDAGEITTVSEISGLDDVELTTLSDGDSLVWNATSGKWTNKELSYEYSVEDLKDVDIDISTLADGDIIKWDATNSKWVKGQIPTIESLDDIGDVTLTALANGQIIKYDAVLGKWVNEDNEVVADLDDLQDVVIDTATLENGQILKYDSVRNVWYNGSATAVSTKVEDLEDVSIDPLTFEDGQVLVWDATNEVWVNGSSGSVINKLSDIEDVQVANLHNGDMIKYDAINKVWYNIGFDNAPTQNSDKMLDSNAVYQSELDIKNKIGDLTQLDTTVKTDLVGAVNELKTLEGDLSNLTTDDKFTLVGAIDEVDSHADTNKANIGTLANLTTVDKSDLVNAINELDGNIKGLKYAKQVTTLGNAEDSPNVIVEYIGATSGDLVKGYFYYSAPSVEQGQVIYTWEQINVQPRDNNYENLNNLPQINSVQLVGNKSLTDLGVQRIMQYSTMPTPSAEWTGSICIQYIGAATADLTPNYFYVCKYITEDAEYKWVNVDVSNNSALATRVTTLETNQGDMSALTIAGVSDLVSAINTLAVRGIKSITYSEPYLTITLMDNSTFQFDITVILNSTDLGDLGNVLDSTIQNGNLLQYDSSISKYKPYDVVTALVNTLQSSKDYTDQEILKVNTASAIVVDAKPTYDSSTDTVVYYQNGQVHVTDKPETRFYYTDSVSGDSYCVSWIDGTEFQYNVASVDYDDFVSKTNDVVSTYNTSMVDKDKIPDIAALDALYAIIVTALSAKTNVADIVDNLLSDDATVPLSAKQGKVLNLKFDDKQDLMQMQTLPQCTAQMVTDGIIYQYTGADSQAYKNGRFYKASYDQAQDIYYWAEVKFSADYDATIIQGSINAPQGGAVYTALQDKQNKTLDNAISIHGSVETTVEGALGELNTAKSRAFQVSTMPQASADFADICLLYVGSDTPVYTRGYFYKISPIEGTDPVEYEWKNITPKVTTDSTMSATSTNPIENQAITNGLQALQEGILVIYPNESARLAVVDYAGGEIVAVGTIAYCVTERTWYKVTAIDSSTLAVTWTAYNPHIGGEVTEGDAIKVDETDGSVNVVADEETVFIKNITYYAWKDSSDNLVYTLSMTPSVGDSVYDNTETVIDTVEAYDNVNLTIDVSSVTHVRDNANNFVKTALEGLTPNTSDFDVAGRNLMLDVTQRTFTGTRAQFNALSSAEKNKYLILNITDEVGQGVTVTNTIVNGSMNVPTANAVYNFAVSKTLPNALTLGGTQYTDTNALLSAIVTLLNNHAYWQ